MRPLHFCYLLMALAAMFFIGYIIGFLIGVRQ